MNGSGAIPTPLDQKRSGFQRLRGECRKEAYDEGFFAKVRSSRAVGSVSEADSLANTDARIM